MGWSMPRGVFSMTPGQRDCLRVICEWVDEYGRPPTYREIAREMDIGSGARNAHGLVVGLIERGWLARAAGRHRGLRILHRPPMPDFTTPRMAVVG